MWHEIVDRGYLFMHDRLSHLRAMEYDMQIEHGRDPTTGRRVLSIDRQKVRWDIETSHMVAVPQFLETSTIAELRRRLQEIADSKKARVDRPPIGKLTFRYELDDNDETKTVHSYFTDRHGKLRRFMRLRRSQC